MTLNETLSNLTTTATPTPYPFENVPIQTIVVSLAIIVLAVAPLAVLYYIHARNQGKKVVIKAFQNPDKSIALRFYYHEMGYKFGKRCETIEEANTFINQIINGLFKQ